MKNEQLRPNIIIENSTPARENLQFFKFVKVVTFNCDQCKKEKTSKNLAIVDNDWAKKICNGCYGLLTSKM
jgi:hypothetical protein